jgi:hypothetical protein
VNGIHNRGNGEFRGDEVSPRLSQFGEFMNRITQRLPHALAIAAGLVLVASFGAAATAQVHDSRAQQPAQFVADTPVNHGPPARGAPVSGAQNENCFYFNHDSRAILGQGSGTGLGDARLVCGTPVSQGPGNNCYYTNYDSGANLGQGSGRSLGNSRLVCQ